MRNRLHSICPYFAMFPEQFVRRHIIDHTSPGGVVFDPFCGRGTTILEALLCDRDAFGTDVSPVAVCLSKAKTNPPHPDHVLERLAELRSAYFGFQESVPEDEFFSLCFHKETLSQLMYLRAALSWQNNAVDCFITAVILGCLHGESHKTPNCLSNRMPRTISTKKAYSVRWWRANDCSPPKRDAFEIAERMSLYRMATQYPRRRGTAVLADARKASVAFEKFVGRVQLVVTSPPYIDTTDYFEDQWLRWWFIGGPDAPINAGRRIGDGRHRGAKTYWEFLEQAWAGVAPLMASQSVIVVRIGVPKSDSSQILQSLRSSLVSGLGRAVTVMDDGRETSILGRQTEYFRPGTSGPRTEHDFRFQLV